MSLYVNGRRVASGTAAPPSFVVQSSNFIGREGAGASYKPFIGTIDEVAIYGHGLTPAQVQAHYLAGRPEGTPPASAYASAVMADAPTAYWRLDEQTLPVARDMTATHDALYVDPVVLGQPGALAGGDGTAPVIHQPSGHVDLQPDQTDFSGGLTVEAWVKPTEVREWSRMFVLNNHPNGHGDQGIALYRDGGSNDLVFGIPSAGLTAPGALTLNTWRHVVGTVTAQGYAKLYIDGQLVREGQAQPVATTVRSLGYIGKSDWVQDATFPGSIDEVALYDYPLTAERVATHYAIGRGAPLPPVVEVSAQTNPITISWSPRDGVVKYDLWYRVDEQPAAYLAELDGTTTTLGLHVSNDATYQFGVQATNALGTSPIGWSLATHMESEEEVDDEDWELFDPTAEPLCIPPSHPDPTNLVQRLLLSRLVCGATEEVGQWQQTSPLSDLLCPNLGPVVPRPGSAILSANDPVCQSLSGAATMKAGHRPGEGAIERIQKSVIEMQGLVGQGFAPAIVNAGMEKILKKAKDLITAKWYHGLNGYQSQATRSIVYAETRQLLDVEASAARWPGLPLNRAPDLAVRMTEKLSGGSSISRDVFIDVKHWMQSSLVDDRRRGTLQRQVLAYTQDQNHRVVLEFVRTKTDPITKTPSQVAQDLGLAGVGVDLTRVSIRIIDHVLSPASLEFVALVAAP